DVFTLFHGPTVNQILSGVVDGVEMTEWFLLGFGVVLELPMLMILGARFLPLRINRIANLVVGMFMTLLQLGTLFVATSLPHYVFFSVIEIGATATIFWLALKWRQED
ncbi:MAG TPA: DUF6326 family protein, partial [Devosiaceae bacterium]|nr:DUF6326 family protein [Devosiaceae bacterium]